MKSITNLSPQQLRQAANLQEEIQEMQAKLNKILGGEIPFPFKKAPKRKMSAAGKAAIRAAQKARWAKIKGKQGRPAKKRKMSKAGRAAIAAAAKARWAKIKAAKA